MGRLRGEQPRSKKSTCQSTEQPYRVVTKRAKETGLGDELKTQSVKRVKSEKKPEMPGTSQIKESLDKVQEGFLKITDDDLDLERTLLGGQSFRWRKQTKYSDTSNSIVYYTGPIGNTVFRLWRDNSNRIGYKSYRKVCSNTLEGPDTEPAMILSDYFRLNYDLTNLYKHWSSKDANFNSRAINYKGLRILRQDPVENVFSFICATNNNIKRISGMVENMCKRFGEHIMTMDADDDPLDEKISSEDLKTDIIDNKFKQTSAYDIRMTSENSYFTFPTVQRLTEDDVFDCLRHELGFGYRAKFITQSAKLLLTLSTDNNFMDPHQYLISLRQREYKQTCKELQKLPGIGRKVADCICLMSMDHLGSVPTDCHIYEIVCRDYMPNLKKERKSLTDSVHDFIGCYFRELHGELAGWSTSVLFVAELKHLREKKEDEELETKGIKFKGKKNAL